MASNPHLQFESSGQSAEYNLRFFLMGLPSIEENGCTLMVPRRQARALCYYLAANEQAVARGHLMNLFWPDIAEDVARRSLSRLLSQTRSLLPDGRALQAVGDAVALCRQSMWADVSRFTELYSKRELLAVEREEIVALYRGPFLDGFALDQNPEFELWVSRERSCWEQRYLQTLLFLTDYYSAAGEYQAAIINAQRYLALDNLAEEVHRRLISLLALTGNSGAARRQFEACRQALHSELKVEPLEETCALHEAIARGQISAACDFLADPSCTRYSITPPRFEEKSIRRIDELFRYVVAEGWGKFLLLAGPKNGNQSSLLSSLARSLEETTEVVRVASYPGERQHPYHAVGELFRALLLSKQPLPVGLPRLWLTIAAKRWYSYGCKLTITVAMWDLEV
jgi:DNA-binding SARP family transcriptional activator